jgi:hypothetical protein
MDPYFEYDYIGKVIPVEAVEALYNIGYYA